MSFMPFDRLMRLHRSITSLGNNRYLFISSTITKTTPVIYAQGGVVVRQTPDGTGAFARQLWQTDRACSSLLCRKYLSWIQNSVFEGEITEVKLKELTSRALQIMKTERDSLIIFKSRDEKWLEKEIVGKEKGETGTFL